jgi:hypothetical protein
MAAVSDIGALPEGLDGILGLSFLSKVSLGNGMSLTLKGVIFNI